MHLFLLDIVTLGTRHFQMGTSIEFVLPVLNEERALNTSINILKDYLDNNLSDYRWSILIADNGSSDATSEIAMSLVADDKRIQYLRLEKRGRGRALKQAWLNSDADILGYMDIDMSTNLTIIPQMILLILDDQNDLVIGSRILNGSVVKRRTLFREFLSRSYSMLIRTMFLTGFVDAQCGFKILTHKAAQEILPAVKDNGWFFDTELLLLAEDNGYSVAEVPVEWTDDPDSRVRIINTIWEDLKGLLRLRFGGLKRSSKIIKRP